LRGIPFRSTCDTETLLYAFAAWGAGCLPMLEGDFAFAIHDAVRSELFLARDPIGVRPLYCYNDGRQFLFASELSAISGLPALDYALAPEVLAQYLLFQYSPSADTPFRYIKKLLPGHCATISLSGRLAVDTQQYYHIPFSGRYDSGNEQDRVRLLDERLRGVVSRQLQADVPVGLMLSGGLDSSLIAALARKVDPGRDIRAFTITTHGARSGEGFGDDLRLAQMLAAQKGSRLHEVSGGLDSAGELDSLIMQLGEQQADPAALHMSHIAAAAKDRGIKVLLSGAGGDDVFSGYRRHSAIPLFRIMAKLPPSVRSIVEQLAWQFPGSSGLRRLVKLSAGAGLPPDVAMM